MSSPRFPVTLPFSTLFHRGTALPRTQKDNVPLKKDHVTALRTLKTMSVTAASNMPTGRLSWPALPLVRRHRQRAGFCCSGSTLCFTSHLLRWWCSLWMITTTSTFCRPPWLHMSVLYRKVHLRGLPSWGDRGSSWYNNHPCDFIFKGQKTTWRLSHQIPHKWHS